VAVLTFLVVRECLIQCRILNDSPARLDFSGFSLWRFSNSETRSCPKKFRFFEFFWNHLVQHQLSLRLYFGIVRIVLLCNIMVQAILEDTLFMVHDGPSILQKFISEHNWSDFEPKMVIFEVVHQ